MDGKKYRFSDIFDFKDIANGIAEISKEINGLEIQLKELSNIKSGKVSGADYSKINQQTQEQIKFQEHLIILEKQLAEEEKKAAKDKDFLLKKEIADNKKLQKEKELAIKELTVTEKKAAKDKDFLLKKEVADNKKLQKEKELAIKELTVTEKKANKDKEFALKKELAIKELTVTENKANKDKEIALKKEVENNKKAIKEKELAIKELTVTENKANKDKEIALKKEVADKKIALQEQEFEYKKLQDAKREAAREKLEQDRKAEKSEKEKSDIIKKGALENKKAAESLDNQRQKALQQMTKEELELKQINNAINRVATSEKELAEITGLLTKKLVTINRTTKEGAAEYNQYSRAIAKNNTELRNLGHARNTDTRNVGNYQSAFKGLGNQLSMISPVMLGTAGAIMGAGAIIGDAVTIVKDFEERMSQVAAITDATGENFENLKKTAIALGSSTVFSATQAAEGMVALGQAGFTTNEIIAALPGTLSLATAGGLDLASSAEIVTNIMSGFGASASETTKYVDILAKAANISNTTIPSLGESFKEIASTAKILKVPVEEVGALINVLGNAGIKGTDATNALQSSLLRLTKPTKEMQTTLNELDMQVFDKQSGEFIGMTKTIEIFNEKTKDYTTQKKLAAAADIFGIHAANQWITAISTSKEVLVSEMTPAMKEMFKIQEGQTKITLQGADVLKFFELSMRDATGAAEKMAKIMADNLAGDIKMFQSAWEGLVLSMDDGNGKVNELIRTFVQLGTKILESFTAGNEITEIIKEIWGVISGLLESLYNLADVLGLVSKSGDSFTEVLNLIAGALKIVYTPMILIYEGIKIIVDVIAEAIEGFKVFAMALNLIDTPTEQAAKSAEQLGKEIFVLQTKTESLTQAQYEQLEGIYKSTAGTDEFAKSIENLNIAQINGLETTYKTILASQNLSEERKKEIETNLKLLDSKRNEILLSESLERISQETDLKRLQREQRQAEKAGLTVGDDINVKKSEARLAKIKELEKLENESFKDKIKMQDATQAEIDKNATKALEKRAEITNDYFNNIDDILETADKLTEKQTFNIFDDYFEDIDTLLEKQDQLTANAFNDKIISDLNNVYEIQSLNNEMLFDEARAAAIKRGDTAEQLAELEKQIEIDKTEFAIIQASARLEVYKKLGIFTEAELLSIEASISALNVKLLELGNKDGDKKFLANLLGVTDEEAAAITEKTGELILKLGDIVSEQQKRKLAEMDEEIAKNEEVIKSLQTKYDTEKELGEKGIANNANKLKAEIILEKKKNEELIAERKKLAKKNQLIMISEAIIAGALAAIKALDGPPIIKWIELAAINVQTIANVATIKSQKFAQGGSGILQGNSHAEGGIPFDGNKEAEGGEMFGFIKKSKVSRYKTDFKNIVSDMNNGTYMPTFEGNQNVIVNNDYNLLIQKQEETNRILSEIYNKPEKHYENGKLKIERIGNKTIFFQ